MIPALTNVPGIDPEYQAFFSALKEAGFPKAELEQAAVRIAVQTGTTIPISF